MKKIKPEKKNIKELKGFAKETVNEINNIKENCVKNHHKSIK